MDIHPLGARQLPGDGSPDARNAAGEPPKVVLLAAALLDRDALDCCEVAAIQKERTQ
jgi:hypothetical protein